MKKIIFISTLFLHCQIMPSSKPDEKAKKEIRLVHDVSIQCNQTDDAITQVTILKHIAQPNRWAKKVFIMPLSILKKSLLPATCHTEFSSSTSPEENLRNFAHLISAEFLLIRKLLYKVDKPSIKTLDSDSSNVSVYSPELFHTSSIKIKLNDGKALQDKVSTKNRNGGVIKTMTYNCLEDCEPYIAVCNFKWDKQADLSSALACQSAHEACFVRKVLAEKHPLAFAALNKIDAQESFGDEESLSDFNTRQ